MGKHWETLRVTDVAELVRVPKAWRGSLHSCECSYGEGAPRRERAAMLAAVQEPPASLGFRTPDLSAPVSASATISSEGDSRTWRHFHPQASLIPAYDADGNLQLSRMEGLCSCTTFFEGILPEGKSFELRASDSGIRQMKVVRIVTPAWKNLRPPERISKVLAAIDGKLSEAEQQRILRFSVLTPEEYCSVVGEPPAKAATLRRATAKRVAAKRKAVGKAKRRLAN